MTKDYYFPDFTENNYRKILTAILRDGYKFISYKDARSGHKGKYIIMRHDIDFSPQRALALAKIEHFMGIIATYGIQLGSPFYNPFEDEIRKILLSIKDLGHAIGLHFDPVLYNIKTVKDLERNVLFENNTLEELVGQKIEVFSFHNPSTNCLEINKTKIAGLINTYHPFFMKEMKYISDSNGYWRYDRLTDVLNDGHYRRLHVLIHPGWWQRKAMPPWRRVLRSIDGRKAFIERKYRLMLNKHGRRNIKK